VRLVAANGRVGHRVLQLALLVEAVAQADMSLLGAGLESDQLKLLGGMYRRHGGSAPPAQRVDEVSLGPSSLGNGEVGLEAKGLRIGGVRLLHLSLVLQGPAEVAMGLGDAGLEPDRCTQFGDRLGQLPLVTQGDTEVGVGNREVRSDPDRRAVLGDCLLQLALHVQGGPEVVADVGIVGLEPDRFPKTTDCFLHLDGNKDAASLRDTTRISTHGSPILAASSFPSPW
jgi:hypothetical protein